MKASTLPRRSYLRLIFCPTRRKEAHSVSTEISALVFASTRSITRNSARPREKLRLTPLRNEENAMKILGTLLLLVGVSPVLYAQQPATVTTRQPRCRPCARRIVKTSPVPANTPQPAPDFYVGEAKVDVVKDQTVVRLAMAQHGSVLIEVPANDGPRYIIPGDPEMATVDQKALERNKQAIIVRPGTLFVPPARNAKARTPAATVTAQMRSGLVVTFLFYPVEDLAQNVHRCVLSYNRDEVVARRRAAGLPVNLDVERREETTAQSGAPTTISVENTSESDKKTSESSPPLLPSGTPTSLRSTDEPKAVTSSSP